MNNALHSKHNSNREGGSNVENISFENFKFALIGFCANLALLGGLAYYIVRGVLSDLKACRDVNEAQRNEIAELKTEIAVIKSICRERCE